MKLTLYPNEYAFLSTDIIIQLKKGLNDITINNIPLNIDTHSFIFSFQDTNVSVISYEIYENIENNFSIKLLIEAEIDGEYSMNLFFKINKIYYNIFYNFLYDSENSNISAYGWVEVVNNCGIDLENVEIQIVINKNNDNIIFTLDNIYKITNNLSTNISFLSHCNIPIFYKYILPFDKNEVVECIFIKNTKDFQIGIPLMPGNISLYFQDKNKNFQNIGNDKIDIYFPNDDILFEIGNVDIISVNREKLDNLNIINLENRTENIVKLTVEINTNNKNIQQSNAEFVIDENGIGQVDLKIMPFSSQKINYTLQEIESISNL